MAPVRFLHTSDWQLGVTRHFLDADAQALWGAARLAAIRAAGAVALREKCDFMVVPGDVFESNQVDRKVVLRTCEALAASPIPTFLLPGNHDPLDAGSVFRCAAWKQAKPAHVTVLEQTGVPIQIRPGVEVVGAPWPSKRPVRDLVAEASVKLEPATGVRVMVGHGIVDRLSPDRDNPALINLEAAERVITEGKYHYLALGDRHSFTNVGSTGRIYYSGTPEAYDFDEIDPGKALVVDLDRDTINVTAHQVGTWRFLTHKAELTSPADVDALARHLEAIPDKERTMLKLVLVGSLTIKAHARLQEVEEHAGHLLAAVLRSTSRTDLVVTPDDADFDSLSVTGFASTALTQLREQAKAGDQVASDALGLMLRLSGGAA